MLGRDRIQLSKRGKTIFANRLFSPILRRGSLTGMTGKRDDNPKCMHTNKEMLRGSTRGETHTFL